MWFKLGPALACWGKTVAPARNFPIEERICTNICIPGASGVHRHSCLIISTMSTFTFTSQFRDEKGSLRLKQPITPHRRHASHLAPLLCRRDRNNHTVSAASPANIPSGSRSPLAESHLCYRPR